MNVRLSVMLTADQMLAVKSAAKADSSGTVASWARGVLMDAAERESAKRSTRAAPKS